MSIIISASSPFFPPLLLCDQLVTRTKKIFVGGLSVNTTIEDVKHYFDQFGKVNKPPSTRVSLSAVFPPIWSLSRTLLGVGAHCCTGDDAKKHDP